MIKILIKRGTATQWSASTTPLASGELGLDTTNNILKAGNGTDLWATLNQISLTSSQVDELARDAIGSALVGGSGISVNVNDAADSITVSIDNTIATKSYTDTAISNLINSAPAALDTLNELATALGNDANFSTTVTNSLAGKASLSSANTFTQPQIIDTSNTTSTTLLVKANPTYPAQLQEWQNASGVTLAQIGYNGNASFYNIVPFANSGTYISFGSGAVGFISRATTTPTVTISGAASQTGNLTEWQDSTGTVLSYITASGALRVNSAFGGTQAAITAGSAATVGLIVRGASSQTADLQQWQRSNGTVDLKVTNFGALISGGGTTIASNPTINAYGAAMKIASGISNYPMLILQAAASQTANLQEWQLNNGFQALRVLSNGSILLGNTNVDSNNYLSFIKAGGATGGNAGIRFGNDVDGSNQQTLTINTTNANLLLEHKNTTGAFIIQGATSQTADLLKWQNSAGTTLGSITANGYFSGQSLELANYGTLSTINLVANEVPVYVVGAASQTADLQQWMDSGLNTIAKIDANGNFKGGLTYEINFQTGTSYTFALSDSKSVVLLNNENNITAYIPTNSIAFPIGSSITVVQSGLGQVTIQALTPATTSILSNAVTAATPRLRGYGSSVTLIKVTAEQWFAVGDIY